MDAFRKIDIDQYDEDTLLDSELVVADPRDASTVLADARVKAGEVRGLLARCVLVSFPSVLPSLFPSFPLPLRSFRCFWEENEMLTDDWDGVIVV